MNLWVLGDTHFGVHVNSLQWLDNQKDYFYNYFIPYIKDNAKPGDVLIQLGDIFENRHFLNVNILSQTVKILKDLADVIPVKIILGNHDVYYIDKNDINSIDILEGLSDNIEVYTKSEVINMGGVNFLMQPWVTDIDELSEIIKSNIGKVDYIFSHMDVQGMTYDSTRAVTSGIKMELLKNFKKVYSGHIHWRQEKGNIVYCGTPYQLNRGDYNNIKGFYKLEIDSGEIVKEAFIENTHSPVYKKVDIFKFLEMNINQIKEIFEGNFVDIQFESNFSKKFTFKKILDTLKDYGIKYQKVEFPPYTGKILEDQEVDVPDKFELRDLSVNYLKYKGYKKSEISDVMKCFDELDKKLLEKESLKIK